MTAEQAATHQPKRRHLQYGLRTLLSLMLVASLALSWLAVKMRRARRQREAVKSIEASGAWVDYDDRDDDGNERSVHPSWLLSLLGRDFFFDVSVVFGVDASSLVVMRCLSKLKSLHITDPHLTDVQLEHLERLTELRYLSLRDTEVSDAGLECLERLRQLEYLDLSGTAVSDAGLQHLKKLTLLRELILTSTQVSDAGVEDLHRALPGLKVER